MSLLLLQQIPTGAVYGLKATGQIVEFDQGGIRELALSKNSAENFDACSVKATILPDPPLPFLVDYFDVSEDGSCVIISGIDPETNNHQFGVLRLDRKLDFKEDEYLAPFYLYVPNIDVPIECIRWFPGNTKSLCLLSKSGIVSVHEVNSLSDPLRSFRLKREISDDFGFGAPLPPRPVDLAFTDAFPWAKFALFVLYSDGCVFSLSPILSGGSCSSDLQSAVKQIPVSGLTLRQLFVDVSGTDGETGGIPVMQGPLNEGLESEWGEKSKKKSSDSAVRLCCASAENEMVSVVVCTAYGKIYSHALIQEITPMLTSPSEAVVLGNGDRVCSKTVPCRALQLMEIIDVGTRPRRKSTVEFKQHSWDPSMAHLKHAGQFYRLQFSWVSGDFNSHSVIEKFTKEAYYLGSFVDLSTSVSIFRNGDVLSAFILRSSYIRKSLMESSSVLPSSILGHEVSSSLKMKREGPELIQLKYLQSKFESLLPDKDQFEDSLSLLDDQATWLQDEISNLESTFYSLNLFSEKSLCAARKVLRESEGSEILKSQLEACASELADLEEQK